MAAQTMNARLRQTEGAPEELEMTCSKSSTAHLSAWDFHLMTLERANEAAAWDDLPEPIEPEPDDRPEDWGIEAELRRRLPQAVAS